MKKILVCIMILLMVSGCGINSQTYIKAAGFPVQVTNEDSFTIEDCYIEEDCVYVKVKLDFSTITISDFSLISIRHLIPDADNITYDKDLTKDKNEKDIFEEKCSEGEVWLVFKHESINSDIYLLNYALELKYNGHIYKSIVEEFEEE